MTLCLTEVAQRSKFDVRGLLWDLDLWSRDWYLFMLLSHEKATQKAKYDDNKYEKVIVNEFLELI